MRDGWTYYCYFLGLDLAQNIFRKAVKKYGLNIQQKQVDSIIKRSEYGSQVDKDARKLIKSLILNFIHNGGDAEKAIQLEFVKQECNKLAREHYRRQLMSKVLFALIRLMINGRGHDPQHYYCRSTSSALNTTLNRMLEGVITESKQSQLDEFL